MSDTRQGTLRDYLRVLRYNRWTIVAVTVLCAGIAAGLSFSQKAKYVASAQVSFQEESNNNAAVGLNSLSTLTAAQLAAEGASTMTSNSVLARVRQDLRTPLTLAQLQALLATSVDASSTLVTVQATAGDPSFAAALANDVANVAVARQTGSERARFAATAQSVQHQYQTLRNTGKPGAGTDLALGSLLDRFTTLQTLSTSATPARLANPATVPSSPSSPKPVLSTIFGGLIGLILGIGVAFLRNSLDRRLRDLGEVQDTLDMPVVGSVRVEALGSAAYMANGQGPMTEQDVESFRVLRTNIAFLDVDRPIKTILVTSPLPAEGKSTVAASLAAANAAAGKATLLLECDLRRPVLADRLPIARSPGISEYLAGEATMAQIVQTVALTQAAATTNGDGPAVDRGAGRLAVIASGGQSIRPAELLGSKRFGDLLTELSRTYESIILDTPPLLSVSDTLEIIPLVDGVLLCIRVDQTTRDQARAVKEALSHLPSRTTGVVVTGLKPGRESDYGYYSYAYEET